MALCIWREARGESAQGKTGVGCVLRNRAAISPREGFAKDIVGNVVKPWAFSAFNANDPNASKWPSVNDPAWIESCDVADSVLAGCLDVTAGAVFYYSPPLTTAPKAWGNVVPAVKIGNLNFFKLAGS